MDFLAPVEKGSSLDVAKTTEAAADSASGGFFFAPHNQQPYADARVAISAHERIAVTDPPRHSQPANRADRREHDRRGIAEGHRKRKRRASSWPWNAASTRAQDAGRIAPARMARLAESAVHVPPSLKQQARADRVTPA